MNWVGGARSRVKYFNRNRVQRDFFESKRLADKVQRLQPYRRKNGSQDLYFFSKTVTGELKPGTSSSKQDKDKLKKTTKHEPRQDTSSIRDLELSVSPIGQSAMFDALDVTTIDEDVSFYGPEQLVKDQPKVSTEKLPHLKARDSFRQPSMKDEGDSSFSLNESILHGGAPAKKLKAEVSAPPTSTKPHPQQQQQHHHGNNYMYSIDDVLNAPYSQKKSSISKTTTSQPPLAKPLGRDRCTVGKGDREGLKRRQTGECQGGPDRKKSKNRQVHSRHHQSTLKDRTSEGKSVVIYDKDTMLEFHFDEQGLNKRGEGSKNNTHKVPEQPKKYHGMDFRTLTESAAVPSMDEQPSMPVVSASNATSSVWSSKLSGNSQPCSVSSIGMSENPLSTRHLATSHKKETSISHGRQIQTNSGTTQGDGDTSFLNESIFGPIRTKNRQQCQPGDGKMAETLHSRSRSAGSTGASEPSVFERMIQNFESNGKGRADCDLVRGQSQGREWIHSGKRDKEIQKNAEWKSFIMGVTKSTQAEALSLVSEEVSTSPSQFSEPNCNGQVKNTEKKNCQSTSASHANAFRNISVLEELICLEEEAVGDLVSQDFPLSPADLTEDPIFARVHDSGRRTRTNRACGFDSSQESVEVVQAGSWNSESNSTSTSEQNSTTNHSPSSKTDTFQPSPVSTEGELLKEASETTRHTKDGNATTHVKMSSPQASSVGANDLLGTKFQHTLTDDTQASKGGTHASTDNSVSQFKPKSPLQLSRTHACVREFAVQTMEPVTRDSSAQCSPMSDCVTLDTATAGLNMATGLNRVQEIKATSEVKSPQHEQSVQDSRQRVSAEGKKIVQVCNDDVNLKHPHVHDNYITELKNKIGHLERELGMAQSTIVWQSLMIRLQQL